MFPMSSIKLNSFGVQHYFSDCYKSYIIISLLWLPQIIHYNITQLTNIKHTDLLINRQDGAEPSLTIRMVRNCYMKTTWTTRRLHINNYIKGIFSSMQRISNHRHREWREVLSTVWTPFYAFNFPFSIKVILLKWSRCWGLDMFFYLKLIMASLHCNIKNMVLIFWSRDISINCLVHSNSTLDIKLSLWNNSFY